MAGLSLASVVRLARRRIGAPYCGNSRRRNSVPLPSLASQAKFSTIFIDNIASGSVGMRAGPLQQGSKMLDRGVPAVALVLEVALALASKALLRLVERLFVRWSGYR